MYNWQHENWPNFSFDIGSLTPSLKGIKRLLCGLVERIQNLPEDERRKYFIENLIEEAQMTSRIEGEFISREDLRSSILNHLYLGNYQNQSRDIRAQGIGKLLAIVAANYDYAITEESIKYWHGILLEKSSAIDIIGNYRRGTKPIQIISGPDYDATIHFEAPPAVRVPKEMGQLIASLQHTYHEGRFLNSAIRAGITHTHFESIHPFQDGNGRIGRALIDQQLSKGIGFAVPFSLSSYFAEHQDGYYDALNEASSSLDLTNWLLYFLDAIYEAMKNAFVQIDFLLVKTRFFDEYTDRINDRQTKAMRRLFDAGPRGFDDGLSAKDYERLTRTSKSTATRELTKLYQLGILKRVGVGRGIRYQIQTNEEE